VTKGAFFHHFESKEALAVAAAEAWTERARPMFDMLPHTKLEDPLDRLLGHIDFRFSLLHGPVDGFTCFVGTMVQSRSGWRARRASPPIAKRSPPTSKPRCRPMARPRG
jgi:AcrR family transcriptional regulator